MRYGHIVTVGTSLFYNTGGGVDTQKPVRRSILNDLEACCTGMEDDPSGTTVTVKRSKIKTLLQALIPSDEFGYRRTAPTHNAPKDRLPQELSYLWGFAQGRLLGSYSSDREPVRLLASDTNECKNCALVVYGVLQEEPWAAWYDVKFDVSEHVAEGVDASRGAEFATVGIHRWMEKIEKLIDELTRCENCERVFLNVTGGYKGTVPYSTLMGTLYADKVQLAYLFEESPEIIYIPSYPIGLDFRRWHENALRLRMATQPGGSPYFTPDPPVQKLLDGGSLSVFGQTLAERYKEQWEVDPLKMYSKKIIDRLLHDEGPWVGGKQPTEALAEHWSGQDKGEVNALRGVLHDLIDRVGDIIWLGDKIPEIIDHAQRHHHNLLEFTELFLTPILYHQPLFLNARERFVLLAAVMLHDCGHSLDWISLSACKALHTLFGCVTVDGLGQEFVLFPDDVRAYHQYLAGIRLHDAEMASDLGWPGRDVSKWGKPPSDLHDAVILACLYHRRRMDYDRDSGRREGILHLTGQWPGALINHQRAKELKDNLGVDLMKVVALLRLIDGCDSQVRRAGSQPRVELTVGLLKRDGVAAALRAEQAYQSFLACAACSDKDRWQKALARPTDKHTDSWHLKDSGRGVRMECLRTLQTGGPTERQCARLWLLAAEAADRAQMRFSIFPHLMKHRAIQEIQVLPAKEPEQDLTFNIILVPDNSDALITDPRKTDRRLKIRDWLREGLFTSKNGTSKPLFKTIEDEVSSEYAEVAGYVKQYWKFEVKYWWQDDWQARENGGQGQPFYP